MYQKRPKGSSGDRPIYANEKIKAFNIMLLGEDGKNLGTVPRARALMMAQEKGLDLVQVAYNPKDKISTAKFVDLGKYLYEKKKKAKEQKKSQSKGSKQVKMGYSIGINDMKMKVEKVKEFLEKGYMVKVLVQLRGRERVYKDTVIERLMAIKEDLQDIARSQYPKPKEERNGYAIILLPSGKTQHVKKG